MVKTLLVDFVAEKLNDYVEPQRAGTPRGDKIGFPKVKYNAALLIGLTRAKQKTIAGHLKISHGLLRKWNVERDFKEMADRFREEFADHFMGVTWIIVDDFSMFDDAGSYGHKLRAVIRTKFNETLKGVIEGRNLCMMGILLKVGYIVDYHWFVSNGMSPDEAKRHTNQIWGFSPELQAKATVALLQEIKAVFSGKATSLREMKAIRMLGLLEKGAS